MTRRRRSFFEKLCGNIRVALALDKRSRGIKGIDPFRLSGNLDVIVQSTFIRIGSREGALPAWSVVEALAEAVEHVRRGRHPIQVEMVAGIPSVWLHETDTHGKAGLRLVYQTLETPPFSREDFDIACEQAAYWMISELMAFSNADHWSEAFHQSLDRVLTVWPALDLRWSPVTR